MENDYPLIPMNEITDEARLIAVRWHENATDWIGDKHKLASDIMNYARRVQEGEIHLPDLSKLFLNSLIVNNIIESYGITGSQKTLLIKELTAEIRKL